MLMLDDHSGVKWTRKNSPIHQSSDLNILDICGSRSKRANLQFLLLLGY